MRNILVLTVIVFLSIAASANSSVFSKFTGRYNLALFQCLDESNSQTNPCMTDEISAQMNVNLKTEGDGAVISFSNNHSMDTDYLPDQKGTYRDPVRDLGGGYGLAYYRVWVNVSQANIIIPKTLWGVALEQKGDGTVQVVYEMLDRKIIYFAKLKKP